MQHTQLNFHKIMFFLDILSTAEEKSAYLTQMSNEIKRVIECFESPKIVDLRQYADPKYDFDDNCPELQEFLSLMIDRYSIDRRDRRVPNNEQLKMLAAKEILEYKKLLVVIESLNDELPEFTPEKSLEEELIEYEEEKEKFCEIDLQNYLFEEIEIDLDEVYNRMVKPRQEIEELKIQLADETTNEPEIIQPQLELPLGEPEIDEPELEIVSREPYLKPPKLIWHGSQSSLRTLFKLLAKESIISTTNPAKLDEFVEKYMVDPGGKTITMDTEE